MRYFEFKNKVIQLPIIFSKDIAISDKNRQVIRNQLKRWQDRGLVIKLKRGIYILNEGDRKINSPKQFIANQLYMPSYVSLEYALNFYGLIPEHVLDVTSVTSRKTARFVNELGTFIYQHIKVNAFRGFKAIRDDYKLTYFIAEPEKAVIDFLYLNLDKIKESDKDIFEESFRFQNVETLSQEKIICLSKLFGNDKLITISRLFCEFIRKAKQ